MYDECYDTLPSWIYNSSFLFSCFLVINIQNYPEKADIACDTCKTNAQHPQEIIAHC